MMWGRFVLIAAAMFLLSTCSQVPGNRVVLETELGAIQIELYPNKAPLSVADFLHYVDEGLYDGQGFYRSVRPNNDPRQMGMSLIQGGRLDTTPMTPPIEHETTALSGLSNIQGSIAIARNEPGTGSAAYFFINIGDNDFLDYGGTRNSDGQGYAVFGQVTRGIEVVRAIQMRETGPSDIEGFDRQQIVNPVIITKAYRI